MRENASPDATLIIPGLGPLYRSLSPYSYAFMRFATGAVMVPHGVQKVLFASAPKFAENIAAQGMPAPVLLAYLTFFTELVGAVCLALGLFTRVAALMIWIEMLVIMTTFNAKYGYFWTNKGIEYALLWFAPRSSFVAADAGRSTG
jgi:putative oxidoreductase